MTYCRLLLLMIKPNPLVNSSIESPGVLQDFFRQHYWKRVHIPMDLIELEDLLRSYRITEVGDTKI